uniref:FAD-binding PCMH-type domain-containing protein n=1 Tax=Pithovirus LCPAC403 TaxID=2506596 RepID=A0A481ZD84_9VIRU|nr:MAG: uncharacterized protein LCPAC403_04060 [Pithovirus LCPAC403]
MELFYTDLIIIIIILVILVIIAVVFFQSHSDEHEIKGLTGKIVIPWDENYEQARTNWNAFPERFPQIIVFAQETQDVVNALGWARKNDVPFRIRSGRHGLTNWSLIDNGLVIDVSDMQKIEINEERGIVNVEPGVTVGTLDNALIPKGYVVPFGDSGSVGIGGISLGGGISLISRTFGTISDNMTGVETVVASGEIIQANQHQNEDLFWASRGGSGNNFGIVTNLSFRLIPAPSKAVHYELVWDDWDLIDRLIEQWQQLAPSAENRFGSVLSLLSRKNGTHTCYGLYLGSERGLRKILRPLLETGFPTVNIKEFPFLEAAQQIYKDPDFVPSNLNSKYHSQWIDELLSEDGIDVIKSFLGKGLTENYEVWMLNFGGAVRDLSPTDTAFFWRSPKFYMEFEAVWEKDSLTIPSLEWVEEFAEAISPFSVGSYVNVPDGAIKDFGKEYYGSNFDRLKRVKRKYDPSNVFRYPQSIPVASGGVLSEITDLLDSYK